MQYIQWNWKIITFHFTLECVSLMIEILLNLSDYLDTSSWEINIYSIAQFFFVQIRHITYDLKIFWLIFLMWQKGKLLTSKLLTLLILWKKPLLLNFRSRLQFQILNSHFLQKKSMLAKNMFWIIFLIRKTKMLIFLFLIRIVRPPKLNIFF